jgi:hypothetical protein
MKIIISEEQFDKYQQKMLDSINKYGFLETVNMLGINRLKLTQLTNIPIKGDTFFDKNEVVVGQLLKDLVNLDDVYNECDLIYDTMSRSIHWVCRFDEGNQIIKTLTYSSPYYNDNDMTPIDTDEFEVIKDGESEVYDRMSNGYSTGIHSPTEFNNVDELISWFENEYKPITYRAIKRHLKHFKEEYNL